MENDNLGTLDEIFPNDNNDEITLENEISEIDIERMTKWRLQKEEKEKKLYNLTVLYGYDYKFDFIKTSFEFFSSMIGIVIGKYNRSNNLQLAELISLLSSCRDNKITISSIVSHPKKGELKSQVKKVELSSPLDLYYLNLWANTTLDRSQDGFYQYEFNWEFNEQLKHYSTLKNEVEYDDFYIEPYTEEQLNTILEHERKRKKEEKDFTRNAEYGRCLISYYNFLQSKDFFNALKEKQKTGKAAGITKEYCFMYDCLVLLEAAEPLDDNKEKYTKVKDWINAFATQKSK